MSKPRPSKTSGMRRQCISQGSLSLEAATFNPSLHVNRHFSDAQGWEKGLNHQWIESQSPHPGRTPCIDLCAGRNGDEASLSTNDPDIKKGGGVGRKDWPHLEWKSENVVGHRARGWQFHREAPGPLQKQVHRAEVGCQR